MDWQYKMNQAIDYLESTMSAVSEEISLEKAARQAGYSLRDFQQIFSFLTNVTVGAYIRKRKLSLAANDIMFSEEKIIDIALKYGYESPSAFSRAFSQLFGVSPSSARDERVTLEIYPKLNFNKLLMEESKVDTMNNMDKYLTRGYHVRFSIPPYLTKDMDKTSEWFVNVLGWFGGTCNYDDDGNGVYGCVYDYPGEIFHTINPQRGFYMFYGEPSQEMVGWMEVNEGGLDKLYKFVKNNGWDKITEPAFQGWGAMVCRVTTIDGSILQFHEIGHKPD